MQIHRKDRQVGRRRLVTASRRVHQPARDQVFDSRPANRFDGSELGHRSAVDGDDDSVTTAGAPHNGCYLVAQLSHPDVVGWFIHQSSVTGP